MIKCAYTFYMNSFRSWFAGPLRSRVAARATRRSLVASAVAAPLTLLLASKRASAQQASLPQPRSLDALLEQVAGDGRPIVAMFSLQGCAWCEAVRREQLAGLAREQASRGIRVVEFDMRDERAFDAAPARRARAQAPAASAQSAAAAATTIAGAGSPATLARLMGIRTAPTLVFLGPTGEEVAPRLVGYGSPDFYSAYLEERIDRAKAALARERKPGAG